MRIWQSDSEEPSVVSSYFGDSSVENIQLRIHIHKLNHLDRILNNMLRLNQARDTCNYITIKVY